MATQEGSGRRPGHFTICGEGMCIGVDSGDNVSREYGHRFPAQAGSIERVEFHVGDDAYVDVERHLQAACAGLTAGRDR